MNESFENFLKEVNIPYKTYLSMKYRWSQRLRNGLAVKSVALNSNAKGMELFVIVKDQPGIE